ncbi:MAG: peptidylprolyl isomerase [Actinomycetota bacterium]|nr:peptidylprolyl isomerase [Actinomycetota bacterium]
MLVASLVVSVLPLRGASPQVDDPAAADSQSAGGVACGGSRPEAAERQAPQYAAPDDVLEPAVDYRARIVTSCGTIVVDLHEDRAPKTTNSFVFLGREGFFDGTTFHRLEPGFVIQGGDPTGTGAGGPGYTVEDELAVAREQGYATGTLAMANSGPNTNGSQFFITLEKAEGLPPNYTIFGRVVEGMDVVQRIGALSVHRDPRTGLQAPDETVYVDTITIDTA